MGAMTDLQSRLDRITAHVAQQAERGERVSYIPELAHVDTRHFGIAVATKVGRFHSACNAEQAFSIQSVSKVFALTLALGKCGDGLWTRVGREPSGSAFNSIVLLEHERGVPRNPFINAGAIAVTDAILAGHAPREAIGEFLRFVRFLADDDTILIDEKVAASEARTGHRNLALAHCMKAAERARRINALMLTCGHYDGSGDFAYRVGVPAKSGVGGGIPAVVPGIASIAVWLPGLNACGNSLLGTLALEMLAEDMGWSVFDGPK